MKNNLILRAKLNKKTYDYYNRNDKFPITYTKVYGFLRGLYTWLTKKDISIGFREDLYKRYTDIINMYYSFNRASPNKKMIDIIYAFSQNIIYNETHSNLTFIYLNDKLHVQKMKHIVDLIHNWSINEDYFGYASYNEFYNTLEPLRMYFNQDIHHQAYNIGKLPKALRQRRRL